MTLKKHPSPVEFAGLRGALKHACGWCTTWLVASLLPGCGGGSPANEVAYRRLDATHWVMRIGREPPVYIKVLLFPLSEKTLASFSERYVHVRRMIENRHRQIAHIAPALKEEEPFEMGRSIRLIDLFAEETAAGDKMMLLQSWGDTAKGLFICASPSQGVEAAVVYASDAKHISPLPIISLCIQVSHTILCEHLMSPSRFHIEKTATLHAGERQHPDIRQLFKEDPFIGPPDRPNAPNGALQSKEP